MNELVYITGTGERVREREGLVYVGLSPEAQVSLGKLLHFQPPKIGAWVEAGDHLFVVEGSLAAAEFYAPMRGTVISFALSAGSTKDCLVCLRVSE